MLSHQEYLDKIENSHVYEAAIVTALTPCVNLTRKTKNHVYLKREDHQEVFSFKIRGAFNKIAQLTSEERKRGLIAVSAGNHAQGVAFAGQYFDCRTIIVMPLSAPEIKIRPVKAYGAEVVLHGDSVHEAFLHAQELIEKHNYISIHPFDDPDVIAGQGTIGKEICEQLNEFDYLFLPIGGGGIAAGIALYVKHHRPNVKLIGVEPFEAASMHDSIRAGKIVTLDWVGGFADGVAVKQVGVETFRLCRELLDEIILVSTDKICAAIKDIFEDTRVVVEPAGALTVAGMKKYLSLNKIEGKNVVGIACGANMNFDRLGYVAERVLLGEKKEVLLAVEIPEKPRSLKRFCQILGKYSITEFNYRYNNPDKAILFLGVSIPKPEDRDKLFESLSSKGIVFSDISKNELAKLHIRHMVGGKSAYLQNERLFRMEFPERSGALGDFLDYVGSNWNISLFHYRSHGSDRGRVLVGLQIPDGKDQPLLELAKKSGFSCIEETDNPVYKMFC